MEGSERELDRRDPLAPLLEMLDQNVRDLIFPASTFAERFSPDGVMEFPYARADGTSRVTGRAAIAAYLADVTARVRIDDITNLTVHRTQAVDTVILEYRGEGEILASRGKYVQQYISVIETAGGRIVRWVDYWNPLAVSKAFGDEA